MQENEPEKQPREPLSWDLIAHMTREEYDERRDEIHAWMVNHPPTRTKRDQKVTSHVDD